MYKVIITPNANDEMEQLKKSGEEAEVKRLQEMLSELALHPEIGIGKPEDLGGNMGGKWSRRINEKNRLVYQIDPDKKIVTVIRAIGHYKDH
ncbi:MAG: Txe/YoeB family addiction module toxin [Bacteroidales bacterium]